MGTGDDHCNNGLSLSTTGDRCCSDRQTLPHKSHFINNKCPAHSHTGPCGFSHSHSTANPAASKEYAFEMACSTIRYGVGVTQEVGMDFVNMKAKKVCVMTDPYLSKLPAVKTALDALARQNLDYELYDRVRVEPTETR
ncbi:hydroxyacid-oxoacid transhydrogenase activity protein [Homalodisca vitripennis]|nr:hydroxyacid-oxoacid transhydrogenase activity protein [Homalodisca vitripennis]KAG8296832.1 hydroxyacid-oxoacid transhydrogenase activity protein [Homalodisca vitripennis]